MIFWNKGSLPDIAAMYGSFLRMHFTIKNCIYNKSKQKEKLQCKSIFVIKSWRNIQFPQVPFIIVACVNSHHSFFVSLLGDLHLKVHLLFMNIPLIKKIMPVHLYISQLLLLEIVPITLKSFSIVFLFKLFILYLSIAS